MLGLKSLSGAFPRSRVSGAARFLSGTERKDLTNVHSIKDDDPKNASKYLQSILEGNRKWVAGRKAEDPQFFDKLAKPQTPKFLYFGCSDSRVPANQILGKGYVISQL